MCWAQAEARDAYGLFEDRVKERITDEEKAEFSPEGPTSEERQDDLEMLEAASAQGAWKEPPATARPDPEKKSGSRRYSGVFNGLLLGR